MDLKPTNINAEKEYESLRQEILQLSGFQNSLINVMLTLMAAFLGFGVNSANMLLYLIPPFVLLFAIILRGYSYQKLKIGFYLKRKYEKNGSILAWETFLDFSDNKMKAKYNEFFFAIRNCRALYDSALDRCLDSIITL